MTHYKTIQKAIESNSISHEQNEYLQKAQIWRFRHVVVTSRGYRQTGMVCNFLDGSTTATVKAVVSF